jgi:hypothetical protein
MYERKMNEKASKIDDLKDKLQSGEITLKKAKEVLHGYEASRCF